MCSRAALLALLLVALPSVTRASPTVHNFSLLSNWSASHDLPFATAYASVILHNGSLAISGGCVDVTCETITNRTIGYDPVAQVEYPLPELNFPIAGRHSTVSLSGSLVAVHMCGMVPYAFTPSHDVLNMVEVYNPGDASFSIISLTADQRRNITRANATCIGFKSFVYIFGGVDMKTSKFLDQMMALDMSVAGQITVYIHTLPDIGAYSLMTGYSDNFAMYLAGGVASLTDPLPQRSVFAIVPSGSSSNPLVGSCRTKMDSRIPFDASLTYLEPTEFQMVGYADWFVVKIGEFFATNINIKTCDAALCNSPNWTIISNPPTNYPESPYLPVAGTRRGASLVGIPLWQAGSNGPSTLSLWQFGGIAELNVTQFHTFQPTTLPPPTTTTTTVAPTTTTVAPPTTPAPNTTTSAPEPPKGVNQHLWDLMNVIWASDSTTEVPAAPGSNSGSGSEPGTPAATYATHWIETAVVGNLTHILTNLALPGLSVQDLNVPLGPVKPFNFSLTCPANETECDFYNSFCFAGQEGFDVCNVGLFSDPECYTSIKSHFLSGEEDVSMTLDNAGLGVRIWACFSYGTKSMSCGNQQPAYSVINFLDPLVTVSSQMTLAPPPTKAPASGQNYLLVAMAALAAVLLVALVGAVVWFKKRQRTAESAVAGRYINMEEIGRGAFGRVIKVKRISDDEVFAMKHIDCPSAEVLQEALKEFELLRKLQAHPNIIRVIDMFLNYEVVEGATGSHDGAFRRESNMRNSSSHTAVVVAPARHLCIVMDYHPSKDLKLWALGFATAIPECILCHIAVQTCSVLSFIHERNVIHRDLKPENILIVKDDRDQPGTRTSRVSQAALQPVVITDFGLAHFVAESRTVGFVGTAVYSAPECVALLLPNRQQLGLPPAAAAAPSTQPRTVAYNDPAAPLLQSRNEPTLSYTAGINAPTPRSAAITRSGRAGSKGTGHTVSAQCDIWSLGCVLYAAATKRMERSNVRKMFEDVNSPTFVADITADLRNAGYSPAFAAFVLRLLKLEPEERPTAKDALKYFRKSNRDQSYHVTETQKLTAEERKRAKMPMAAPPAPSINRLSGSTTTPPSTRPSSKRAIDSPPTTASKAPPVPAQEGLVVPPPRAQYRTAEDTAAPPPAAPTREPSRLRENSVDRGSSPRVVVVGSPQGSKRAAPRSSSDGERESLRTRDTPRTPSPTVQAGTARGHNGVGATVVVVSSGEEDKILAEYSDRDD